MTLHKTEEDLHEDTYGADGQLNTLISPHVQTSLQLLCPLSKSPQNQSSEPENSNLRRNVAAPVAPPSRAPPKPKAPAIQAYVSSKANTASKPDLTNQGSN